MTTLLLPQLTQPAIAASWNDFFLATGTKLGLPVTDWEANAPTRTTFAIFANALQMEDVDASLIAQAGFLDYAASGSVTYVDLDGNTVTIKVTPDPSIPSENPTGALGALDVLADAVYDVQRVLKSAAAGALAILNTTVSTFTYAAGAYHVAQPSAPGSPTYANAAALSIAPSTLLGTVTGTSNSGGLVRLTTAGTWTVGQTVYVDAVGGTTEANGAWLVAATNGTTYIDLAGSTYANAWTGGGKVYAPTIATFAADNAGTGSSAAARRVTQAVTSIVGVSVSNPGAWSGQDTESNVSLAGRCRLKLAALANTGPAGAYKFFALTAQDYAAKLTPPLTGRPVLAVTQAVANLDVTTSTYTITIANANGGATGATYPTNGTDDHNDVWAVGMVEQAFAAPQRSTFIVQGAANNSITVAMQIWSPFANGGTAAQTIIQNIAIEAIAGYFRTIPPGGVTDPGGASNVVPIEGVRNAVQVALAASYIAVQDLTCTLNGSPSNVLLATYPSVPQVPIVSGTPSITATGV